SAADDYAPADWWDHDAEETDEDEPVTTSRRARPSIRLTPLTGGIDLSSVDIDAIIDDANEALDAEETNGGVCVDAAQPGT
ncbi:hypothetical protein ABEQ02_12315, partial [Cutibacterium acnes]